jgi:hypothetical protein
VCEYSRPTEVVDLQSRSQRGHTKTLSVCNQKSMDDKELSVIKSPYNVCLSLTFHNVTYSGKHFVTISCPHMPVTPRNSVNFS